ncbi:MAG: PQQ-dependent sugar dehydrogenase [Verrucomicrobia bacterium]|nr:PQQ-dependent sugar dehydrogenase [Verrucomicrobiota bacterium]MDA1069272.1 PQQ-dependent sugar dehydrogenase [Verrucomicrobiota bacterium]
MKQKLTTAVFCCILITSFSLNLGADWKDDYAVAEGFRLEIDSQGYRFPTAIAFVPNPGTNPDSPLYFVTEIRGRLMVVSNDRTVRTFAEDFFKLEPVLELPEVAGEIGMAGLCLEPENGYIFVSYAYEDEAGLYRNGISRFQSEPGVFSLQPTSRKELAPIFKNYLSAVSHQIGPIAIYDGNIYVSIGDAEVGV